MARVVLITGAAGGIGRRLVGRFALLGDTILAQDLSESGLDQVAAECAEIPGSIHKVIADITDAAAVTRAIDGAIATHGAIDVLVANAGGAFAPTIRQTTIDAWHRDVDLNLNGTMHTVHAVLQGMIAKGKGNIVVIGSVNAILALGHPAYSAAKAGLISYVKSLAAELGRVGIRANIILPGTVRTPTWQERLKKNPALFDQLIKWYPLGRIVEANDIAEAAIFLASDAAAAITGVALPVDCGLLAANRLMASELTMEDF
ncbi:MAG: SDR family oxidoreductase [Verrucomicrobia bacterium]|nr:SDR family oxidoreductase [Verrucomicrobiota bacterium]